MLESVLTLVVFLALFIGVFDMGEMMFVHQTLTDRARNAVRWGSVNTYDATGMTHLILYGATTPSQGQTASFGLNAASVVVSRPAASIEFACSTRCRAIAAASFGIHPQARVA